jgi:hypothetical protein
MLPFPMFTLLALRDEGSREGANPNPSHFFHSPCLGAQRDRYLL